ncbi:prepilin peptidase [Candidatus Uhrbacteria bacterium]|nr:MAG: prepilin peptidase [Candidatus Uhrbacteria bacterium]
MNAFLVFLFGTIVGSLLNALVFRLRNRITLWGRSQCPACKAKIHPAHLVPVVSFFFLQGRCVQCGARIHWSYPTVELAGGLLWLGAFLHQPEFARFILEGGFLTYLLFAAAFDWRWRLLPIEPMAAMTFAGLFVQMLDGDLVSSAAGLLIGAGFLGLQYLVSGGKWMGLGDLWLGASIGAWLGWQGMLVAFYLCYLVGGLFALALFVFGIWKRGQRVAFAPFLALGAVGAVWFGPPIAAWFAGALGVA